MPFLVMLVAFFALAFLLFEVLLCVRVWRLADLPVWRRVLPTSILCFALAASAGRAWDVTALAGALAYPLNVATSLLGMFELDRHRQHARSGGAEPSARAAG